MSKIVAASGFFSSDPWNRNDVGLEDENIYACMSVDMKTSVQFSQ